MKIRLVFVATVTAIFRVLRYVVCTRGKAND